MRATEMSSFVLVSASHARKARHVEKEDEAESRYHATENRNTHGRVEAERHRMENNQKEKREKGTKKRRSILIR